MFKKNVSLKLKTAVYCGVHVFVVLGRRNQLNQATSFIDASFLYGHNDEDAHELRSFMGGML